MVVHGQHRLGLVVDAVPVQLFKPVLVISRLPAFESAPMGVAVTRTQFAMESVVPLADPAQVLAESR